MQEASHGVLSGRRLHGLLFDTIPVLSIVLHSQSHGKPIVVGGSHHLGRHQEQICRRVDHMEEIARGLEYRPDWGRRLAL